MPKRKHESKEEKWRRKLRKYEERLKDKGPKRIRRVIYSSDDDVQNEEHLDSQPEIINDTAETMSLEQAHDMLAEVPAVDEDDNYNAELLSALGDIEEDVLEFGEDLEEGLAKRFQKILTNGLKNEAREELCKQYLFPKNVPLAKAPTLNPEIGFLPDKCKVRDKRLAQKQDQIGKGLSALGKAMTALLRKGPDISAVIKTLNDAARLIADSHYAETETRRSVITPWIEKTLAEQVKDRPRDNFLFGDKLDELVRSSRGISKTGKMLQATTSTASSLNWKGPRLGQSRPAPTYPHRGPNQLRVVQQRRRVDPPPPPPPRLPARRAPPQPSQPGYSTRRQPPSKTPAVRHRY